MNERWIIPPVIDESAKKNFAGFRPIEQQILFSQGFRTIDEVDVFFGDAPSELHDPFRMDGMTQAVERVVRAVEEDQKILVYGDYDADGVSATALLVSMLQNVGGDVEPYIPDRFTEGYGLNKEALTRLSINGYQLLITVDCGIRANDAILHANHLGFEVIVTDHHSPGEILPPALSVLNPKKKGDHYPYKGLAGVGLAYKLVQGLHTTLGGFDLDKSLGHVAIGTVGDLAPLTDENRELVRQGLDQLNVTDHPGIRALTKVSGVRPGNIDARAIGFRIAPRINAAGRIGSAMPAFDLLNAPDANVGAGLAEELDLRNRERQQLSRTNVEIAQLESGLSKTETTPYLVFAASPKFHEGVVGLAAGRIAEEVYRPVVIAKVGEPITKGSARSIPEFHITDALDQCEDLLERHGGHAAAAGFSVKTGRLSEFQERLGVITANQLKNKKLQPSLQICADVRFEDLDQGVMDFLDRMEPFGQENPVPVFASHGVRVHDKKTVGSDSSHLKLIVDDGTRMFEAIAFRKGAMFQHLTDTIDIAYHFERNDYMGFESFQLNIKAIRLNR